MVGRVSGLVMVAFQGFFGFVHETHSEVLNALDSELFG